MGSRYVLSGIDRLMDAVFVLDMSHADGMVMTILTQCSWLAVLNLARVPQPKQLARSSHPGPATRCTENN